jgi:hypothetical protein
MTRRDVERRLERLESGVDVGDAVDDADGLTEEQLAHIEHMVEGARTLTEEQEQAVAEADDTLPDDLSEHERQRTLTEREMLLIDSLTWVADE